MILAHFGVLLVSIVFKFWIRMASSSKVAEDFPTFRRKLTAKVGLLPEQVVAGVFSKCSGDPFAGILSVQFTVALHLLGQTQTREVTKIDENNLKLLMLKTGMTQSDATTLLRSSGLDLDVALAAMAEAEAALELRALLVPSDDSTTSNLRMPTENSNSRFGDPKSLGSKNSAAFPELRALPMVGAVRNDPLADSFVDYRGPDKTFQSMSGDVSSSRDMKFDVSASQFNRWDFETNFKLRRNQDDKYSEPFQPEALTSIKEWLQSPNKSARDVEMAGKAAQVSLALHLLGDDPNSGRRFDPSMVDVSVVMERLRVGQGDAERLLRASGGDVESAVGSMKEAGRALGFRGDLDPQSSKRQLNESPKAYNMGTSLQESTPKGNPQKILHPAYSSESLGSDLNLDRFRYDVVRPEEQTLTPLPLNSWGEAERSQDCGPLSTDPAARVNATMKLAMEFESIRDMADFKTEVRMDISAAATIDINKVSVREVRAGSVVIELELQGDANRSAFDVACELQDQLNNPDSKLLNGKHTNKATELLIKQQPINQGKHAGPLQSDEKFTEKKPPPPSLTEAGEEGKFPMRGAGVTQYSSDPASQHTSTPSPQTSSTPETSSMHFNTDIYSVRNVVDRSSSDTDYDLTGAEKAATQTGLQEYDPMESLESRLQAKMAETEQWNPDSLFAENFVSVSNRGPIERESVDGECQPAYHDRRFMEQIWPRKLVGLGVGLTKNDEDGRTYIKHIVPGMAADKSGLLLLNDIVLSIDGAFLRDLSLDEIKQLTMSQEGTSSTLVVLRKEQEGSKRLLVSLTRIKAPSEVAGENVEGSEMSFQFSKHDADNIDINSDELAGPRSPEEFSMYVNRHKGSFFSDTQMSKIEENMFESMTSRSRSVELVPRSVATSEGMVQSVSIKSRDDFASFQEKDFQIEMRVQCLSLKTLWFDSSHEVRALALQTLKKELVMALCTLRFTARYDQIELYEQDTEEEIDIRNSGPFMLTVKVMETRDSGPMIASARKLTDLLIDLVEKQDQPGSRIDLHVKSFWLLGAREVPLEVDE